MAKQNVPLFRFNQGEIGRHALGRIDVDQLKLAAEEQTNFIPMTLGPMQFRPGLGYLGATASNNQAVIRPFIFSNDDTAVLEFTDSLLRIWVDDELITANSVSTSITNGDMSSSTGWTLTTTDGATASISGGALTLNIKGKGSSASCERAVTVAGGDQNVEHRVRITVTRGPVGFRIGSATGLSDFFADTTLGTGTHSIAFTPSADFYIRFIALSEIDAVIDSAQIESAGTVTLPTPWPAADLVEIRQEQSGDIVFCAQDNYQQRQIERRDNNSWSVVLYEPIGGPYQASPAWASKVFLYTNAGDGTGTMSSTKAFFSEEDVNSIICVDRASRLFEQNLSAVGQYTDPIEVTGVTANDRDFAVKVSGTWVGTLTLYRSSTGPDDGFTVATDTLASQTSNGDYSVSDYTTHANRNVWYRIGFSAYTSGTATVQLDSDGGLVARGQARIIGYSSSILVSVEKFDTFPNTVAVTDPGAVFRIADWSDRYGWPSSVAIHDGRLWWGGRDKIWGSISDDYSNFEETFEGEAGPINRSFGYGPFARVNWLCSLNRLIAGRDSSCVSIRSSNFDAPLTPTDFTMKDSTTIGTAQLPPVRIDKSAVFVDRAGRRVYELRYDVDAQDYVAHDLTELNPDIGLQGFVDIAVQRQPDTRVHVVRGDGKVAVLSYERGKLEAWWKIETDGVIESVCVLPGSIDDDVYYVVKRTINGSTVRYLEKLARQDEATGAATNKMADSFVHYSGASTTTITGLSHLEGETVVAWGNTKDLGDYTVVSGQIALSEEVTNAVVGLEYTGRFKSAKLAYAAQAGTALMQKKRAAQIGLMLIDTHYQGLEIGQDFDTMDNLPQVEDGTTTDADTVWTDFDAPMFPVPGRWDTDARICLRATAPRPATVAAASVDIQTNEKV